jgi:hypothetical protein
MNPQSNDERFADVHSTLNHLAASQRHLLTAQVILNDRMDRAEAAIEKLAEYDVRLTAKLETLAGKVEDLADGQKHTDAKLDALADIVRLWIERHGNGSSSQHPS